MQDKVVERSVLTKCSGMLLAKAKGTNMEKANAKGKRRKGKVKSRGAKRVSPTPRFWRKTSPQISVLSLRFAPMGGEGVFAQPLGYFAELPLVAFFVLRTPAQTDTGTILLQTIFF